MPDVAARVDGEAGEGIDKVLEGDGAASVPADDPIVVALDWLRVSGIPRERWRTM